MSKRADEDSVPIFSHARTGTDVPGRTQRTPVFVGLLGLASIRAVRGSIDPVCRPGVTAFGRRRMAHSSRVTEVSPPTVLVSLLRLDDQQKVLGPTNPVFSVGGSGS